MYFHLQIFLLQTSLFFFLLKNLHLSDITLPHTNLKSSISGKMSKSLNKIVIHLQKSISNSKTQIIPLRIQLSQSLTAYISFSTFVKLILQKHLKNFLTKFVDKDISCLISRTKDDFVLSRKNSITNDFIQRYFTPLGKTFLIPNLYFSLSVRFQLKLRITVQTQHLDTDVYKPVHMKCVSATSLSTSSNFFKMSFRPSSSSFYYDFKTAYPLINQMLTSTTSTLNSRSTSSTSTLASISSVFSNSTSAPPHRITSSATFILPLLPQDTVATNAVLQHGPAVKVLTNQLQYHQQTFTVFQ